MRILRKLVYVCCSITLGLMALSSCEGGELYDVNAPDWISEKVDSIADSKKEPEEEVLEGMPEMAWGVQSQHQSRRQYLL